MHKVQKYLQIRVEQLIEELNKNHSQENTLILGKAIEELNTVLDLVKRERALSGSPYADL